MKHSANFEQVTPEMARQFLTFNTNNRPISQDHVSYLADEIRQGRFMPTTAIHLAYDVDGRATLINGQHVASAIIKANKPVLLSIVRSTSCTPEEQQMLYMDTDIARKRLFSHSAIAYRLPQRMNITSDGVNRIAGALRFISMGFGMHEIGKKQYKLHESVLFEHVPRWAHEARLLDLAVRPMAREYNILLRKAAFYSVALVTMFYQPERAKDFWSQVIKDDGLALGDPRKELHKYMPTTRRLPFSGKPMSAGVQARAASLCWNAFWEGRSLKSIRVTPQYAGSPIVLKGTSYSGNQATNFYPHRDPNHTAKPSPEKQHALISTL